VKIGGVWKKEEEVFGFGKSSSFLKNSSDLGILPMLRIFEKKARN
jgi:hypothetical protein